MKQYCLLVSFLFFLILCSSVTAADDASQTNNAWYWYNNAVDLANEGKYQEALAANEKALAINASFPLAQANKAGILVQLGRYQDALETADKALSLKANTSTANAVAYSNKGDALRHLGRIDEAKSAFAQAYALDNTTYIPDLDSVVPSTVSQSPSGSQLRTGTPLPATTQRSSLPVFIIFAAIGVIAIMSKRLGKPPV
jgi:tetratricopeptide (TPR) repeat protein